MRHRLLSTCRPTATDAYLARRAAAGDDDAFEKLYVRYQPRLEAYCRSIVRHDEDARDAVQNAMTKALVALRRDDKTTNVQGWLFRIAHNEAISLLRRRRPTTELADVLHDRRLGPAGDLLLREELRATLDGVRALPGHLQHPLLLRELAGLSYGQVAEVVGGTPAAARKAVFDARTALSADRAGRDEACSVIRQSLSEGDGRRRRARVVRSHLQSCHACCAWESEQRERRHQLAALLPAAGAAGSAGSWLAGLFGSSTVAAGLSGTLATNAKIAASLAVIAAGAAPVVQQVEHVASTPAAKAAATTSSMASEAGTPSRTVSTKGSADPGATAPAAGSANARSTVPRSGSVRSASRSDRAPRPPSNGGAAPKPRDARDTMGGQDPAPRRASNAARQPVRADVAPPRDAAQPARQPVAAQSPPAAVAADAQAGPRSPSVAARAGAGVAPAPARPAASGDGAAPGASPTAASPARTSTGAHADPTGATGSAPSSFAGSTASAGGTTGDHAGRTRTTRDASRPTGATDAS
jgi:RNA polymerase sigma factor (sigma-70 family)